MKDIIILAMGPSRANCPFDSKEVWGVNTSYRQVYGTGGQTAISPNAFLSKIFICHRGQEYDAVGDPIFFWDELGEMAQKGIEIVSLFDVKEFKKRGISFKRMYYRTLARKFNTNYWSDTIAYQVAYALHLNTVKDKKTGLLKLKEPMRIRLYGVDMHDYDGYATERGGVEYFIAIAKTLGVEVFVDPGSAVCTTDTGKPYGFSKSVLKVIEGTKVMELQKTTKGIRKLVKMGILPSENAKIMLAERTYGEISIRPATDDDINFYKQVRDIPEVYKGFYSQNKPLEQEEHEKWWFSRNQDWFKFIIMAGENRIGIFNIGQFDHWNPEIGYALLPQYWGNGFGKRAVWLALSYIKSKGRDYCHTTVKKDNTRSLGLLYSLGFKVLGEAREGELWLTRKL